MPHFLAGSPQKSLLFGRLGRSSREWTLRRADPSCECQLARGGCWGGEGKIPKDWFMGSTLILHSVPGTLMWGKSEPLCNSGFWISSRSPSDNGFSSNESSLRMSFRGCWRRGDLEVLYGSLRIVISLNLYPIGSMYAIYGNIYHQYIPNVTIYSIHGSYGYGISMNFRDTMKMRTLPDLGSFKGSFMECWWNSSGFDWADWIDFQDLNGFFYGFEWIFSRICSQIWMFFFRIQFDDSFWVLHDLYGFIDRCVRIFHWSSLMFQVIVDSGFVRVNVQAMQDSIF